MINIPPLHASKRIDVKLIPEILKTWQLGQILESRARTSSNAQGELQVQIGQHLFDAKSKSPIVAGEELKLQVTRLGAEPLLKILGSSVEADPVTLFLRQAVPQPASLKTLFNLVNQIAPVIAQLESTELPEVKTLSRQIESLLQTPVKADTPLAGEIKQFLQRSGFNFENQLLNNQPAENNIKLNLIKIRQFIEPLITTTQASNLTSNNSGESNIKTDLASTISTLVSNNKMISVAGLFLTHLSSSEKNTLINALLQPQGDWQSLPPRLLEFITPLQKINPKQLQQLQQWLQVLPALTELRQLIDQSLSTITNNQLQALQADADSAFMIIFNLLVAKTPDWIDLFNIKLSRETDDKDEAEHWRIVIQMELPGLGKIEAKLSLIHAELHTGLIAESKVTQQLISDNLQLLEQGLINAGFTVATLSCHQQTIKPLETQHIAHGPLLDDKA